MKASEDTWREGVIWKYITKWAGLLYVQNDLLKLDKNCEIKTVTKSWFLSIP